MTASRPIPSITRRAFATGIALAPVTLSLPWRHVAALQATPAVAPAGGETMALGINDAGQIVVSDGVSSAILTLDGDLIDIGPVLPMLDRIPINNRGQVVGYIFGQAVGSDAVLWDDGQVTDLPMSFASDINDAGQVCGSNTTGPSLVWEDGELTELPTIPDIEGSRAVAINNAGQVVGFGSPTEWGEMDQLPLFWDGGQLIELSPPPSWEAPRHAGTLGPHATATGISNAGHIVGWWHDLAVLWRHGEASALPIPPGEGSAVAGMTYDVNSRGQVAGSCRIDGSAQAVLWGDGEPILLPTLPGGGGSWATAINEAGQVVGMSDDGERSHAVLWQDGEVIDLEAIWRGA